MTICPPPPLWHGVWPPSFLGIPPYYMSGCQFGGIIPYITTLKILKKNEPISPSCITGVFYLRTPPMDLSTLPNLNKNTTSCIMGKSGGELVYTKQVIVNTTPLQRMTIGHLKIFGFFFQNTTGCFNLSV